MGGAGDGMVYIWGVSGWVCVCVCGGGGGGGGSVTSNMWHSTDVRAECSPPPTHTPFQRCQV